MNRETRIELDGAAVRCFLPGLDGPMQGKYVVGETLDGGQRAVAFDPSEPMHAQIGARYGLRVLGGGYCRLDPDARRAELWGSSAQFGREPDRRWTVRVLEAALGGYTVTETD